VSCILAGSGGRADCIISDQGSEFHGFLMELLKILEIKQEFTASHRAAAHGTVEKVNRTLADTMAHLEATEEKWHLKLPWAKLAYNAGIHRALSMDGNGLSPAMVHLGRQLQVPAAGGRVEESQDSIVEGSGPTGYVEDMVQSIKKMNSWVQESQKRYNQEMEEARKRKGFKKNVLIYKVGDLVWVKKAEGGSKTGAKVALANEGPFEVLEVQGANTYSVRRIGEAVSIRKKIHAENMGPYSDIREVEAKVSGLRGPYKKKEKQGPKEDHETCVPVRRLCAAIPLSQCFHRSWSIRVCVFFCRGVRDLSGIAALSNAALSSSA
jgi:hypothetical protein